MKNILVAILLAGAILSQNVEVTKDVAQQKVITIENVYYQTESGEKVTALPEDECYATVVQTSDGKTYYAGELDLITECSLKKGQVIKNIKTNECGDLVDVEVVK